MSKRQPSSSESKCPSCHAALHPNARFCHECGKPTGERRDKQRWDWKSVAPIVISIAAFAAVLAFMLGNFASEQNILPNLPQSDVVNSSPQLNQPVDLSTMTQREAADHLFNRVMLANERGDTAQATQFAPMALEAYRLVERPDADAYYHMGLISMVIGDLDEARRQVENIKRESGEHLLGLALAMSLAERVGDESAKQDILARFAAAYEAEMGRGRPEYEAHSAAIEKLNAASSGVKDR